ncbi:MAG: SDR family NAD(P)-dependent oxidoreductase [Alistipes sp.]|jgi:short-subunit dehydrogenase|uniref:SDR family NAD(P)-dependent oxidoreductase n=1 Tax=uncultured Alistipes sp. TaxID=538949 RepID=UPI002598C23A|nr:SDR family NAD(P)-dependent oxidoreductase [uncultured Alistipes sp.]MCI9245457.1 SDR family NAD(P)-dependent oxidoreductase [Alistipes sp.]
MQETTFTRYALVTGASSGLGRCFALELARQGVDTVLVALPGSGLATTVDEARKQNIRCVGLEADLSDREQLSKVCRKINADYPLFMLIDNAGIGGTESFADCGPDYLDRIIQLNVRATTLLTHQLLPNLRQASQAYILNVSSMAAFSPVGYKTIYPASKRYIHDFTRGLYEELRRIARVPQRNQHCEHADFMCKELLLECQVHQ